MKDKRLHKFIAITLCVTLLTISASRVTRVSALASTAAIAGTAFIATGLVYLSYLSLTGASISVPRSADLNSWLGGIGRKVSQFPSGSAAYQEMYQYYAIHDPIANVIDGVWTWTQDKLISFVNDFANVGIIGNIVGEYVSTAPLAQFDYTGVINPLPTSIRLNGYGDYTMDSLMSQGYSFAYTSAGYRFVTNTTPYIQFWNTPNPVRNYRSMSGGSYLYSVQEYVNGAWVTPSTIPATVATVSRNDSFYGYLVGLNSSALNVTTVYSGFAARSTRYPQLIDMDIYDSSTGNLIRAQNSTQYLNQPNWNDNDNRPIIPWVPIPTLPSSVPTPSGYSGTPQWGFDLSDLLDQLEDLAEGLMDLDVIARLINEFAGQHGDNYYLEYNDDDTNYFTYYQPTIYDDDTEYVTYNIDVSDVDEHLPVDLNTIEMYTNNRYLDEVKRSALAGGSIIRDFVVFWYDVDPLIVYVFFGSCIVILVAAFIGKWGHS